MKHSAYVGLVALILLGAFPILADPGTLAAQAPELQGGVRGHVASDAGGPIGGAWVNAADAGGNVVNSAITSADGAYDLSSLPPGSYQLTASARGHKDGNASVLVSGAVPVEKDFKLVHTGPVISGSVTDGKTGRGVANATVEASWSFSCKYDQPCPMMGTAAPSGGTSMMQPMPTSTATKSDGSYVIAVEAGHYSLRAFKDNYRDAYGEVEAQGATQMDFKLVPLSAKNSALEGRVLDAKSGKAIPNAWVNAYPYQAPPPMGDCPPNAACATDASGAPAPAMMPCCCCDYEGNSTQADDQGHYKLGLRAGSYMVSASAQDYGQWQQQVTLAENETRDFDIELPPIPPDSVTIQGNVKDKVTGKPVSGAWISVENQEWGGYASAQSDETGHFSLKTKPGWALLWIRADNGGGYAVPSGTATAEPTQTQPDSGASSEGNTTTATPIRAPEPRPYVQPSGSYYPWVKGAVYAEDQVVNLEVQLVPKPHADARIVGYVLNATNHQPIVGAYVNVHNEDTGDWGSAQTDADGSYVLLGREGVHTVQAYMDGYFANAVVVQVSGKETRVDLTLQPGAQKGYCCIMYAKGGVAMESGAPSSGGAANTASPQPGAPQAAGDTGGRTASGSAGFQTSGSPTYQSAGGLGPYTAPSSAPPEPIGAPPKGGNATPAPGIVLVAGALAAVALLAARRRR